MKKVFSVVLAGALFQVAFAETQTQNSEQVAQDSAPQEVAVAPAKKENKLKDLVTNAKVSGFGFARFFTINGFDNIGQNGQSQQYRIKLDVTSGKIYGFSATAGLFFLSRIKHTRCRKQHKWCCARWSWDCIYK